MGTLQMKRDVNKRKRKKNKKYQTRVREAYPLLMSCLQMSGLIPQVPAFISITVPPTPPPPRSSFPVTRPVALSGTAEPLLHPQCLQTCSYKRDDTHTLVYPG